MTQVSTDLAIIGAGPAGLFAAYYAGFRKFSVTVIDALPEVGGQVTAMYPEKEIFDIAGFPSVLGRELIDRLSQQAATAAPTYLLDSQVVGLEHDASGVTLSTANGHRVEAKAVIITGGIGSFTPRPLPTGNEWLGKGLVHFVPSLQEHAGHADADGDEGGARRDGAQYDDDGDEEGGEREGEEHVDQAISHPETDPHRSDRGTQEYLP